MALRRKCRAVATIARAALVTVLVEGSATGKGATDADFSSWHSSYGFIDAMLDPELAKLTGLGPFEAVPAYVAFDAKSLTEVGRDMGWPDLATFQTAVEGFRTKAKAIK